MIQSPGALLRISTVLIKKITIDFNLTVASGRGSDYALACRIRYGAPEIEIIFIGWKLSPGSFRMAGKGLDWGLL